MNILLTTLISLVMTYEMPKLPYANNGLEPVISQATIDYHYGKHLQTYVNNLNSLAPSTEFEGKTVEEIVASAPDGAIFNNAGQVLNHTLYFLQFTPKPNECLTTSGNDSPNRRHIVSPRNGKLVEGVKQIAVVTTDGSIGEILSTSLFAADSEQRKALLAEFSSVLSQFFLIGC